GKIQNARDFPIRLKEHTDFNLRIVHEWCALIDAECHRLFREIVGKTREGECTAEIVLVFVVIQAAQQLPTGLEAPSAAGVHPEIAKLDGAVVIDALVLSAASVEGIEDVDRNVIGDRTCSREVAPVRES